MQVLLSATNFLDNKSRLPNLNRMKPFTPRRVLGTITKAVVSGPHLRVRRSELAALGFHSIFSLFLGTMAPNLWSRAISVKLPIFDNKKWRLINLLLR